LPFRWRCWDCVLRIGCFGQVSHASFHVFARLKNHYVFLRHFDLVARLRIPRFTSRPLLDFEYTKITQFDSSFPDQRIHDRIEGLLNDFLRLLLSQTHFFGDRAYDVFFCHYLLSGTLAIAL